MNLKRPVLPTLFTLSSATMPPSRRFGGYAVREGVWPVGAQAALSAAIL